MLLCAGLSTRLGRLGAERPKPMLPVCGVPILAYGITNLVAHGVTDLVINTHHRGDVIRDEIGDGSRFGARIQYIQEDTILGTGGGLKNALPLLDPDGRDEPFISANGKLIFDLDITALLAAYRRAGDILGMMVVRRVPEREGVGRGQRPARRARRAHRRHPRRRRAHVLRRPRDPALDHGAPARRASPTRSARGTCRGCAPASGSPRTSTPRATSPSTRRPSATWSPTGPCSIQRARRCATRRARSSVSTRRRGSIRARPSSAPVRICARASIGPGVTVGPYAVVGEGARVERSITRTVVWAGATASPGAADPIVT